MTLNEKGYTVQCCSCLCILGISEKDFQEEDIYCMRCGKERIDALNVQDANFNVIAKENGKMVAVEFDTSNLNNTKGDEE